MNKISLSSLGTMFFLLGLATCTWDKILTWDLGGFTLKSHQLFFLFAWICLALPFRKDPRPLISTMKQGFALSIFALFGYYALSAPLGYFPLKSVLYSGWLLFDLIVIWQSAQLLAQTKQWPFFYHAAMATAGLQAVVILVDQVAYQFGYTGGFIGFNQDAVLKWGASRPHAFSFEPSYISAFLALALVLCTGKILEGGRRRFLDCGAAILFGLAIIFTTSRTGLIGAALGIVLLFIFHSATQRVVPWRFLAVALGLIGFGLFALWRFTPPDQLEKLNQKLFTSVLTGQDGSGNARLQAYEYAYIMARDTHWAGTGLGASYKYWRAYGYDLNTKSLPAFDEASYGSEVVMSIWGQLLAEGGLPGLLLYALAAFLLLKTLYVAWRNERSPTKLAAFCSALVFFGFIAFWLGNIARGDAWVWFSLWCAIAGPLSPARVA